ncbi:hypothetical protein [Nocardioides pelophilus]|uniref:hypothetical protein n=1 Tax=Nocardioides pelophilus TaxID=2172019 RepID=UPI00160389F7|nr:hypothetical protein [Nocardioides pelophilus]
MTLNRHSRIAVAAVIAPLAVLAVACGNDSGNGDDAASDPTSATSSDPTTPASDPTTSEPTEPPSEPADPSGVDYVLDGVWHQADGDEVDLPEQDYYGAVIWNDQLVATRVSGEVFAAADVIAADGSVVETFDTTSTVAVNEAGTTIAWIDTDGEVMTAWQGDQVSMGSVDLSAPGETVAYFTAAVTGGPNCYEVEDGCVVFVNSGVGEAETFDSHGINDNPVPFVVEFSDVSGDNLVSFVDKIEDAGSCGGLVDLEQTDNRPEWRTCDYEPAQISPDSTHVIGLPSYYDGLGIPTVTVLDAKTGEPTGQYSVEGGFISQWAWSTDGHVVFDAYDGARWHLFAMAPDGAVAEIAEPTKGKEFNSPFTVIDH